MVNAQEEGTLEEERYRLESMPKDVLENMMNALVCFTIMVTRAECAAKLSQNRNSKDYENIIGKLKARGDRDSIAIAEEMISRQSSSSYHKSSAT